MASEEKRLPRRIAGLIAKRLPEIGLQRVRDPRGKKNKRWLLGQVLGTLVVGMCAGVKSLAEVETWTQELSGAMRRLLSLPRRLPDTSARELLVRLQPGELRSALHRQVKAARRRKALDPVGLPLSVLTMDGKTTTIKAKGGRYVQEQDGRHVVRTVTCTLSASRAKPCIDAIPIPAKTNEMGFFMSALASVLSTYGKKLFQVVDYDAGATSLDNAAFVIDQGLDYFLRLKANQPTLMNEAVRLLGHSRPVARSEDTLDNATTVVREVFVTGDMEGFLDWGHLRTVVRVRSCHLVNGVVTKTEDRYWISSLAPSALSGKQWLLLVRNHWSVENENHHTLDTAFREDDRPWITASADGFLAVLLLRRLAYNVMAFLRRVTLRSEESRATPWKQLMRWFDRVSLVLTHRDLDGLANEGRAFATI